ncbi:hypothetical protein EZ428_23155 [Pedobacter frigiditerrae]|uniref:Outer membrane protein beta-barrel domain-containing protein n=1 Tax=Pedobacter frigiditerrae TaxID=2530452 RepID=A0A4R0MJ33_9SPHI|nr:hypothetical protein [Pedobacter frigiditerrae]TCC86611.1 hypothetical protein EZ428_23155 [Pedobacter frigiditerrae]
MKTKILIISVIAILLSESSFSQKPDFSGFNNLYLGFELGKSKSYDNYVNVGIWAQYDHNYLKIAISDARDNRSEEQKLLKGEDDESHITTPGLTDFGLIYGKTYTLLKRHQFQFGTGVSVVAKTIPDEEFNRAKQPYYLPRFNEEIAIGLPAELRYSFQFNKGIGINASWRGNANGVKSYGNFSFGASIGMF